jgi:hypothetical protein
MSTHTESSAFTAWELQWFQSSHAVEDESRPCCQYLKHFFSHPFEHNILCLCLGLVRSFTHGSGLGLDLNARSDSESRVAFWGQPTVLACVPVYCLFEDLGHKPCLQLHRLQRLITNSHLLVSLRALYICTVSMLTHVVGLQTGVNVMLGAGRWHEHRHTMLLMRKY